MTMVLDMTTNKDRQLYLRPVITVGLVQLVLLQYRRVALAVAGASGDRLCTLYLWIAAVHRRSI